MKRMIAEGLGKEEVSSFGAVDTWEETQADMNNFLETLGKTRHLSL